MSLVQWAFCKTQISCSSSFMTVQLTRQNRISLKRMDQGVLNTMEQEMQRPTAQTSKTCVTKLWPNRPCVFIGANARVHHINRLQKTAAASPMLAKVVSSTPPGAWLSVPTAARFNLSSAQLSLRQAPVCTRGAPKMAETVGKPSQTSPTSRCQSPDPYAPSIWCFTYPKRC